MKKWILYPLIICTLIIVGIYVASSHINKNTIVTGNLSKKFNQLHVDEALIFVSQGIDGFPRWSQDDGKVFTMNEGIWMTINLDEIKLQRGFWHGNVPIGYTVDQAGIENSDLKNVPAEITHGYDPRSITTSGGMSIALEQGKDGLGTILIISTATGKNNIWSSDSENCHSLSLSHNEKFLAYICELNGLIVRKL